MQEPVNNIVPFKRVVVTRKKEMNVVPEYKLRLLEHVMLEQFDGPDEIAGYVVLTTCILTLAPTHHQPTIGMIAIGIGTCLLLPTLMRG